MKFVKMHGAGNDFLLVDGRGQSRDWSSLAKAMCQRNLGAGGDGLLVAVESKVAPVRMLLYNADGSEAEMSGNGVRCFAKYVVEDRIAKADRDSLAVETGAGMITVGLVRDGAKVTGAVVDMGRPRFLPSEIPLSDDFADLPGPITSLDFEVGGQWLSVGCVSMGNPHAVHFIDTPVAEFPLSTLGPLVEHHEIFPARTNFEVARIVDRRHIESRTWERGVGETLACGTGACAIMVSARLLGRVDDDVEVHEPGGVLKICWDGESSVVLTGPAERVYTGEWPE